jgi:hypothetical protein
MKRVLTKRCALGDVDANAKPGRLHSQDFRRRARLVKEHRLRTIQMFAEDFGFKRRARLRAHGVDRSGNGQAVNNGIGAQSKANGQREKEKSLHF